VLKTKGERRKSRQKSRQALENKEEVASHVWPALSGKAFTRPLFLPFGMLRSGKSAEAPDSTRVAGDSARERCEKSSEVADCGAVRSV
jgi:hypothetical protein